MGEKKILRISKNKENPYVMINKNVMQNDWLSWKARGLMGYLLSLPDDWVIYLEELEKHSQKDGRDSLASGIKELIEHGYIVRETMREKGRFSSWTYTVFESPQTINGKPNNDATTNGKSNSGLSITGKPTTTNTHLTNNDFTKKNNNKKGKANNEMNKKNKYERFYL